ncbi:MAG: hypothetical protein Q4C89_09200 [Deinococcus sp.]|uniref:hypothetical protein n=1 Tax=Deinococcus sp. TaxID=47478 RepID=UPI0026DCE366|nr:hypothetical protein [Deinococcus sp.]MDO4246186.1 hypothetical protein [Deinococcus sp.]
MTASVQAGKESTAHSATPEETQTLHARYVSYSTAEDVQQASDYSLVGRVIASRVEVWDLMKEPGAVPNPKDPEPMALPSTVYTVQVETVLKGDVQAGETLEFSILGGVKDDQKFELSGAPVLTAGAGDLYLFNLVDAGWYPTPVNLQEGVLAIEQNDILPVTGTELSQTELAVLKESVSEARAD